MYGVDLHHAKVTSRYEPLTACIEFIKIFVKNVNGRKAVLYIQVNKKFFKPNKDTLNIYIEGLWRMWHSQLKNNGMIASNKMVHLVLLSEENIIVGGSRYEKSEDFWVAKK